MKPENQVCSLELSKKLKKLGVPQESVFYWRDGKIEYEPFIDSSLCKVYSAFTVAELGEMLPISFIKKGEKYAYAINIIIDRNPSGAREFRINYFNMSEDEKEAKVLPNNFIYSENEANARAKMLCYLLENKLMNGLCRASPPH